MSTKPAAATFPSLDLGALGSRYEDGARPAEVLAEIFAVMDARVDERGEDGVWIASTDRAQLLAEAKELERRRAAGEPLPLFGVPFAVKDNIDVAGLPTTAACPAFAYTPKVDAPVVARLRAAGALCLGKTNLDQFATGLVGVRSPYGIPRNPFDARYIPGGSSSGSAVAVAAGLVSFALGTDTAGSGRVPAAFNNIVGLKPTHGVLSTTGVVPACRSLDCVSVFALTVEDAARVAELVRGYDESDPAARADAGAIRFAPTAAPPRFRFGVPAGAALDFRGDLAAKSVFDRTLETLAASGGQRVDLDFAPFREAGGLLYDGPFVAERLAATGSLLASAPGAIISPVRTILESAARFDAAAAFEAQHRLRQLRRAAGRALAGVDFLLVPTTPTIFRIDEVEADPLGLNSALGAYANFVNLLDLAAMAVPTGFRSDGLPAGATVIGPAGSDARLAAFAALVHRATSRTLGAGPHPIPSTPAVAPGAGLIPIVVVGAHLSGEPLNHQLTMLDGRFVRATRTAPVYRLYALPNTTPAKPGLARVDGNGVAIEVEVWGLSAEAFGTFVAAVPPPLCIGSLSLADGSRVSGFLCEGYALAGATDISSFGGWRAYRQSPKT
ncbi:MAG TPA: allophanate hydrolase [Polyangia bacterium]|nr:allophanate hydrolase [Polyangia bacterium]